MIPKTIKAIVFGVALRIQSTIQPDVPKSMDLCDAPSTASSAADCTSFPSDGPTDKKLRISRAHDIQDKIHTTLVNKRTGYSSPDNNMSSRPESLSSSTFMPENNEPDYENEYIRRFRRQPTASVDPYVLQQNRKFDDLIQKNLLVYEQEQREQEAIAAAADLVVEGKTTDDDMMGVFSRINRVEEYLLGRVVDISVSRFVGNMSPGIVRRTFESADKSWLFGRWGNRDKGKDKQNTDVDCVQEAMNNNEDSGSDDDMKQLVDEERRRIQLFLSSLDEDSKQMMFDQLSVQMEDYVVMSSQEYNEVFNGANGDNRMYANTAGKTGFLDKCEQVTILTIKIFFVMLKLSIPMAKYFYTKFLANEYFLFNYDNFNRFVQFMINLLNSLESELQTNEKVAQFQRSMDNLNEQEQRRMFYMQEREQLQRHLERRLDDEGADSGILLMPEETENTRWGSRGKLISSFVTSVSSNGATTTPSTPPSHDVNRFEEIDLLETSSTTIASTNVDLQDPKYTKYFSPSKRLVSLGFVAEAQTEAENQSASRTSSRGTGSSSATDTDDENYNGKHISVLDAAEMFADQL